MAISRPIGKNTRLALFQKEATEGTFVAPTQSQHFVSEGMKYTPQSIEDPSNIGQIFTSDMIKSGYGVEGAVEMKAHPYFIGDSMFFALGKSDVPVNPAQGYLIIWYTGAATYVRIRKVTTVFTAETSTDGSTWADDAAFGTAGDYDAVGLTLTQIATAINAFVGYKAKYVGYSASPVANLAAFANVTMKSANQKVGACIQPFIVTSTISKMHSIYADNSALTDIPSFSMAIDRNFGTAKDIGLAGCKIASLAIKTDPKNLVGLSMNIVAKSQDNAYTYAAAAVPTSKSFTTNTTSVFVDSMVTQDVKDLSLNINNNFYKDEAVGVDTFNAQGRQGASIELSGNMNLTVTDATDEETISLQGKMQNDTPVEVIIYMESSEYSDLVNNVKYSVLMRVRSVKLTDCSPVVSGPDRITLPFAGKAVASVFGNHIDVYCTNQKTEQY
jgi:hypothetical protein